jgi:hypothetical protein
LADSDEARRAYQTPGTLDSEASIRNHRSGIDHAQTRNRQGNVTVCRHSYEDRHFVSK